MDTALKAIVSARARHNERARVRMRTGNLDKPITLIAFTDPNDLLSYRIPPDHAAALGLGVFVVNVIASNADTYAWYAENPYPAHTDYDKNPDVLRLLFDGSERSRVTW